MTRWEYRILNFYSVTKITDLAGMVNELGGEGWELAAIDRADKWVFKRPLEEDTVRERIPPVAAKKPPTRKQQIFSSSEGPVIDGDGLPERLYIGLFTSEPK